MCSMLYTSWNRNPVLTHLQLLYATISTFLVDYLNAIVHKSNTDIPVDACTILYSKESPSTGLCGYDIEKKLKFLELFWYMFYFFQCENPLRCKKYGTNEYIKSGEYIVCAAVAALTFHLGQRRRTSVSLIENLII